MSDNKFEIDGVPVWTAECEIDGRPAEEYVITVTYKGKYDYNWTYYDVFDVVENGPEQFLKKHITFEEVDPDHAHELYMFFTHWLEVIHQGDGDETIY